VPRAGEFLPTVVSIDVEPDRRPEGPGDRPPWDGWAACHEVFGRARKRFERASGAPARWSWFFRTDPQVAALWGNGGHAIETHCDRVEEVLGQGDEVGVHCHPWRLAEDGWVDDYADPEAVARALDASLEAFEAATGRPCRSVRLGSRWLDDVTVRRLARRGVAFDLTVEPGFPAVVHPASARVEGTLPDYRRAPRTAWRPDGRLLRPARPDRGERPAGPWLIPVSTGSPERRWRAWRRRFGNLVRRPPRPRPWARLGFDESPRVFSRVLDRLLASRATTHLSLVVRSDAGLPFLRPRLEENLSILESRVRPQGLRLVRPDEAVAAIASLRQG
jgi:hypothetical protein